MKAENPKAVFQAMRPVFSDLVAEIQRSIGFFTSNNRNAKLGDMIALGNPMKLPGLQRFLSQNLDQEVKLVDNFNNLVTGSATAGSTYKDNQLTFGVAYGLCVQALDRAQLRTNLLPEEIVTKRLVKAKKPWVVAAAAMLLVGLAFSYFQHYRSLMTANVDDGSEMARQITAASEVKKQSDALEGEHTELTGRFDEVLTIADNLQSNVDGRLLWLELLTAINTALPKDERPADQRKETAEDIANRPELHITSMDCEYYADLTPWQASIQKSFDVQSKANVSEAEVEAAVPVPAAEGEAGATEGAAPETAPAEGATPAPAEGTEPPPAEAPPNATTEAPAATTTETPLDTPAGETPQLDENGQPIAPGDGTDLTKGGWVIEMVGHHFHNSVPPAVSVDEEATPFVINTFCKNLKDGTVKLPDGEGGALKDVKISDLGVKYPVVVFKKKVQHVEYPAESVEAFQQRVAALTAPGAPGAGQPAAGTELQKMFTLGRYDFVLQFMWQPQPRSAREEKEKQPQGPPAEGTDTAAVGEGTTPAGT
jgi:type IV pilus assembly protein PilM